MKFAVKFSITLKIAGGLAIFFLQGGWMLRGGGWENFAVQGGAEPLGGARKSRGAETPLDSMKKCLRRIKKNTKLKYVYTKKLIEGRKIESAETRMGKEDGGIARHSTRCSQGIDWKKSKVVVTERNTKQRKVREGIESEKLKFRGKTPLNNYDHPDDWKSVILEYVRLKPPKKD